MHASNAATRNDYRSIADKSALIVNDLVGIYLNLVGEQDVALGQSAGFKFGHVASFLVIDVDHFPPFNPSLIFSLPFHINGSRAVVVVEMHLAVIVGVFVFRESAEKAVKAHADFHPFYGATCFSVYYFYCKHKLLLIRITIPHDSLDLMLQKYIIFLLSPQRFLNFFNNPAKFPHGAAIIRAIRSN